MASAEGSVHRVGSLGTESFVDPTEHRPKHPLVQLQGPFEESLMETFMSPGLHKILNLDAATRRKRLLESETYERTCSGKWCQREGEKYHPLWKLIAQLSFGMHLLAEGKARSDLESLKILQTHVDEIDGFLQRTTEDFELCSEETQKRIELLKVPLGNLEVFDKMLEDDKFRESIVDGNVKIDFVAERSLTAVTDSLKDIKKGFEAIDTLGRYLKELRKDRNSRPAVYKAVHKAMVGNVEGWVGAFADMRTRGENLSASLIDLTVAKTEVQYRVDLFEVECHVVGAITLSSSFPFPFSFPSMYMCTMCTFLENRL